MTGRPPLGRAACCDQSPSGLDPPADLLLWLVPTYRQVFKKSIGVSQVQQQAKRVFIPQSGAELALLDNLYLGTCT